MAGNHHSMNISGYWSVIGKWRMFFTFNGVGGLNWYTTTNKDNHKKNQRQLWSLWRNGTRCVERSVRKKREVLLITRVLRINLPLKSWCSHAGSRTNAKEVSETCSREITIKKISVHRILRGQKWNPYIPSLFHGDRRLQSYEFFCQVWRKERFPRFDYLLNWSHIQT